MSEIPWTKEQLFNANEKLVHQNKLLQERLAQLQQENIKLKGTISAIGQMCGEITKFVNESLEGKGNESTTR